MPHRPNFLDCPPRYTRIQREQHDNIGYACSLTGVKRKMDWQDKVVVWGCVIAIVAVFLLAIVGVVR